VDNTENSLWYQSRTLSSVREGITSARLSFRYRVVDNDNANSIVITVLLDDGTDNTTIFTENVTESESGTFTSVDNNVIDNVDATGTYAVFVQTQIAPDNSKIGSNIEVRYDDVNLSIVTYDKSYAENTLDNVEEKGETAFSLVTILAIVVVAALIIGVVMRAIGGAVGGRMGGAGTVPPAL
jgi:hypothetical protein